MKNIACRILLIVACLGISGISCSKSEVNAGSPTIELLSGENLITKDTTAFEAATLNFKIHCSWNGENTLTNLIVSNNETRLIDEGMNFKEFERNIDFAKSSYEVDSITFTIRDIIGNSASTSLKIEKKSGSGGGDLVRYNNINVDAQNVPNSKSFIALSNGVTYSLQEAFGIQQNITLTYYYDALSSDANTLASPGANIDASVFSGTYGLSNWTTKNTIRYVKITLTQQQFEAIIDPVFVVNSYGSVGNRKAKNLAVGDVYSFKDESTGKYGILRISNVTGQDAGKIILSIVVQK
ncbi:MAG: hypothetical protein AB9846_00780 [Tenuifilaceae bacterium]